MVPRFDPKAQDVKQEKKNQNLLSNYRALLSCTNSKGKLVQHQKIDDGSLTVSVFLSGQNYTPHQTMQFMKSVGKGITVISVNIGTVFISLLYHFTNFIHSEAFP